MASDDDLRDLVTRERRQRYRSVRAAAIAGGISNTRWQHYESGEIGVTDAIRRGVAVAFGWPVDWPENPVTADQPASGDDAQPTRADLARMIDAAADRVLSAVGAGAQPIADDVVVKLTEQIREAATAATDALVGIESRLASIEARLPGPAASGRRPAAGRQRR